MQTGNPVLTNMFESVAATDVGNRSTTMTASGTANKTLILLGFLVGAAALSWSQMAQGQLPMGYIIGGSIVGLIAAFAISFLPSWGMVIAPIYAIAEGVVLGGVSMLVEQRYEGVALQATGATFGTLFGMLLVYQSGLIRLSSSVKFGIAAATLGIFAVYLADVVGRLIFGSGIPVISSSSPIGIGFSVLVIVVAAFNLLLDFDFIERAAATGAPKYMEWYGAFGLLVTLVWLYIEFLRLFVKLQSSRD